MCRKSFQSKADCMKHQSNAHEVEPFADKILSGIEKCISDISQQLQGKMYINF